MEVAAHARIPVGRHMIEGSISKSMELKWVRRTTITKTSPLQTSNQVLLRPPMFPIYISTDPRHVDPNRLRDLYGECNHSCHRFPSQVAEPVDIRKLRIALSHSAVVVSVFCKPHHVVAAATDGSGGGGFGVADLLQSVTPVTPSDGELVGFGRAVSDCGLTASIYDVMVIPSLRRMGIGRMIIKKIVRMLTNREVYDIAALCSESERLFLKACGFGSDILGSTTMMYMRNASATVEDGEQTVTRAGQKLLLVPPLKGLYKSSRAAI